MGIIFGAKVITDKTGRRTLPDVTTKREHNYRPNLVGLDFLAPFASSQWGEDTVYLTESLANNISDDGFFNRYIYLGVRTKIIRRTNFAETCIGEFYDLLSEEEKRQFITNYGSIMKILYGSHYAG